MALGTGVVIPAQLNLTANHSEAESAFYDVRTSCVPRNPDGTVYDTTDATGVLVKYTNQQTVPLISGASASGAIMNANTALLIDFTIQAGSLLTAFETAASLNVKVTVFATDGVTTVPIAIGNMNANLLP